MAHKVILTYRHDCNVHLFLWKASDEKFTRLWLQYQFESTIQNRGAYQERTRSKVRMVVTIISFFRDVMPCSLVELCPRFERIRWPSLQRPRLSYPSTLQCDRHLLTCGPTYKSFVTRITHFKDTRKPRETLFNTLVPSPLPEPESFVLMSNVNTISIWKVRLVSDDVRLWGRRPDVQVHAWAR
jgi:hypothetical protein